MVLASVAAYLNSTGVPLLFDDLESIGRNHESAHFSLREAFSGQATLSGRPVATATLLFNRLVSGDRVWSYHAINILIHAGASLLLFGIVRRTLELQSMRKSQNATSLRIGFSVALLWLLHPLQTESVTYIVQRVQSLMGFFYLMTVYGFVRSVESPRAMRWRAVSVAACALGMATKEDMVSAPLIVLLYDRLFVSKDFHRTLSRSNGYYCFLASTWALLGYLMVGTQARSGTVGFGSGISAWTYLVTQCQAIVHYLGLTVWPSPLVFDYGRRTIEGLSQVWPQALLLSGLAGATFWGIWRGRTWSFLGAWFFATLAPTSSFVPVVSQTMAEHRFYLALAAPLTAFVLVLAAWMGRRMLIPAVLIAAAFGFLTLRRNADYRSAVSIWADTASKLPTNERAYQNLGAALVEEGRWTEAIAACEKALQTGPELNGVAHANLGRALLGAERPSEALSQFEWAKRSNPNNPELNNLMGMALASLQRWGEAVDQYEITLRQEPNHAEAHNNLANALTKMGRIDEALSHYEFATRLRPEFADAQSNWGRSLAEAGRASEAVPHFVAALAIRPGPDSESDLASALGAAGRWEEAISHFETALQAAPSRDDLRIGLGEAYFATGARDRARAEYEEVLRREPTSAEAHYHFANMLAREGKLDAAVPEYEATLRFQPDQAEAQHNLAVALMELGRPHEALPHFAATVRLAPDSAEAHHEYAQALGEVHRWQEAEEQETIALRLQPGFVEAQEHLDWLRRQ